MDRHQSRAFIVDDDKSFGRSLKRLLMAKGFAAEHFESARAFLDSVPSCQKGFAIVDIHMPDYDGLLLIERMLEMRYRMPLIAVTGQTVSGLRDRVLQQGAAGFLQKPFDPQSLMDLIETLLELKESSNPAGMTI